jgi:hypothetical protein
MAIEDNSPVGEEEIDVEEEAVVTFDPEEGEEQQLSNRIFMPTWQKILTNVL